MKPTRRGIQLAATKVRTVPMMAPLATPSVFNAIPMVDGGLRDVSVYPDSHQRRT